MGSIGLVRSVASGRWVEPRRPRMLTHIVTWACNARCVMCDSWKKRRSDELDLPAIERVYRQLPTMGIVRLSGGEPFVREDFPEIVAVAERTLRPAVLHITTNGFQTRRIVELCERRERRSRLVLLVSIDAVGDRHDQIRGVPRAWQRALETVSVLGPRQRELGIRVLVNQTVVDRSGADEHRRLWNRLARYGVSINVVVAYAESATYSTGDGVVSPDGSLESFGRLDAGDIRELIRAAEDHRAQLRWPERLARRYYLDGVRARLVDGTHEPNPPCAALGHHIRLLPNGDVPTCQFNSQVVGNLDAEPFQAIWHGAQRLLQRRWVRSCRGCWAECEVLPSALFSGDLLRALRPSGPPA